MIVYFQRLRQSSSIILGVIEYYGKEAIGFLELG